MRLQNRGSTSAKPHLFNLENMTESEKFQACCFFLIGRVNETRAGKATITEENVTFQGESIGTWKITIEKVEKLDSEE